MQALAIKPYDQIQKNQKIQGTSMGNKDFRSIFKDYVVYFN